MDQLAGVLALVTENRLGRLKRGERIEAEAPASAAICLPEKRCRCRVSP
jgi:hypothetical protein